VVRHLAVVRMTPEPVVVAPVLVIAALNRSRSSQRYGWAASLPVAGDNGAEFCISARIRGRGSRGIFTTGVAVIAPSTVHVELGNITHRFGAERRATNAARSDSITALSLARPAARLLAMTRSSGKILIEKSATARLSAFAYSASKLLSP
jgi:hypothetical protein